ncbi:MAG: hypothetical protein QOF78_1399 [Phycisphaerales bacterium]|nr:hypothetical protein [Phycisphaerales bacterium]
MIDLDSGGATIDITYRNQRVWGMVIGFGLVALAPTAKIIYDATIRPGSDPPSPVLIAAAVLFAMLALASGVRGHTPALHLVADPGGLRMRGGVLGEDLQWRRDEIVAVTAEDLEPPQVSSRRISIVIEFSGDEYVVFPLATREEQAAVVEALRIALKLTPPEPDRVRPVDV